MCRPVSYRMSAILGHDSHRVAKCVAAATLLSCVVNAPRFLEIRTFRKTFTTTSPSNNSEEIASKLTFEVTDLRRDPNYIR